MKVGRDRAAHLQPGILEACRQGERDAFRVLFEACKDGVYSIALNFTGSQAAAQDITQDVFVKLFHAIRGFRGDADFRTWLHRLVVNACIDESRRKRRFVPIEEAGDGPAARSSSQELRAREKEVALQVRSAVASLAPKLRLPILLRYVEGLSYSEIGDVLKCSLGTVASRLNRGHKVLARRLAHLRGAL